VANSAINFRQATEGLSRLAKLSVIIDFTELTSPIEPYNGPFMAVTQGIVYTAFYSSAFEKIVSFHSEKNPSGIKQL
jgi:hypothetical protein